MGKTRVDLHHLLEDLRDAYSGSLEETILTEIVANSLDSGELGRLVDSTVWVNESHPAHQRAVSSRSEGCDLALTAAMSLAPLAVEARDERAFVTSFLERWGEVVTAPAKRGR